jgi:hypothetical protein
MLDDETRDAARRLATRYGCSASEAIRRSVLAHRNTVFGVSEEVRQRRLEALERLIELFDGHDADAEIRQLKIEDEFF